MLLAPSYASTQSDHSAIITPLSLIVTDTVYTDGFFDYEHTLTEAVMICSSE